jgi:hypothetical protein
MPSPLRRAGAREEFGTRHPHLAMLIGDQQTKGFAQIELGKRSWLRTLFGGRLVMLGILGAIGYAATRVVMAIDWSRVLGMAWPWVAGGAAVVGVVVVAVRVWRSPYRF